MGWEAGGARTLLHWHQRGWLPLGVGARIALNDACLAGFARDLRRRGGGAIFLYHNVAPVHHGYPHGMNVTPDHFAAQLERIARHFRIQPLTALLDGPGGGADRPAAALTFDDGYAGVHRSAFPLLRARGLTATVFVSTGAVETGEPFWWDRVYTSLAARAPGIRHEVLPGVMATLDDPAAVAAAFWMVADRLAEGSAAETAAWLRERFGDARGGGDDDRPLTWDQLRELREAGFGIGNHGHRHLRLTALDDAGLADELDRSAALLHDRLDVSPELLAVPFGTAAACDARVAAAVGRRGYRAVFLGQTAVPSGWPAGVAGFGRRVMRDHSYLDFRTLA